MTRTKPKKRERRDLYKSERLGANGVDVSGIDIYSESAVPLPPCNFKQFTKEHEETLILNSLSSQEKDGGVRDCK